MNATHTAGIEPTAIRIDRDLFPVVRARRLAAVLERTAEHEQNEGSLDGRFVGQLGAHRLGSLLLVAIPLQYIPNEEDLPSASLEVLFNPTESAIHGIESVVVHPPGDPNRVTDTFRDEETSEFAGLAEVLFDSELRDRACEFLWQTT